MVEMIIRDYCGRTDVGIAGFKAPINQRQKTAKAKKEKWLPSKPSVPALH